MTDEAKSFPIEPVPAYTPTNRAGGPNLNPRYWGFLIKACVLSLLNVNFCPKYCGSHGGGILLFHRRQSHRLVKQTPREPLRTSVGAGEEWGRSVHPNQNT